MSYIDDFIQKLNQTAPEVKSLLREIKMIDYETEKIQLNIQQQRQIFLKNLQLWEAKKQTTKKKTLQKKFHQITIKDKQLLNLSKQKVQLAEKLYNFIHQPTEKLDKQLHVKGEKFIKLDGQIKSKKGKRKGRPSKQEWENDPNQPKYCYCGKPSYGEMVMCENTYCEKQWFHRPCIEEKKLPDKWFCKECRAKR